MRKSATELLPPLLFAGGTSTERRFLARLKKEGKIRQIGPRVYSSVPASRVAAAVRGSWSTLVSTLFPGSLLSHRTALEFRPGPKGEIFLTGTTNRVVQYPGLRLIFVRGPGALIDDGSFLQLSVASQPRAMLENLSTSRSRSRSVDPEVIESKLEQVLRDGGAIALNRLRDRAREISVELDWPQEFRRLDGIIGALLGTRSEKNVKSSVARARVVGEPYDPACLERLQLLFGEIRGRDLPRIVEPSVSSDHLKNKAFFEAYFSNYIEGTEFEIEEAEDIIFGKKIPVKRPADAHDIVGTFSLVSDLSTLRKTPEDFGAFLESLRSRHRTLMEYRPQADPGKFKSKPNRAGDTYFVIPEYVQGTLKKGFELYLDLPPGLARAIFVMFLIVDVHPFVDGNGRIARVQMNSELVSAELSTIIIPNVFREDYLLALRALTRRNRPTPLVDMLFKAQKFSNLEFTRYPKILKELQQKNWFREPDEAQVVI